MSKVIGFVKDIQGTVKVKLPDGTIKVLKAGDPIHAGEIVLTENDGQVTLLFENNQELSLDGGEQAVMDKSVYDGEGFDNADVQALQEALLAGQDIDLDNTAAGAGADGGDGGQAQPFIAGRTGDTGNVDTYNLGTSRFQDPTDEGGEGPVNQAPVAFPDFGFGVEVGTSSEFFDQGDEGADAVGNLLINDVDDGLPLPSDLDIQSISFGDNTDASVDAEGLLEIDGLYGTLYVNAETGEFRYEIDNDNEAVQVLNEGETLEEVFGYVVTDGDLSDDSTLTITINGTNDAPEAIFDKNGEMGEGFGLQEGEGGLYITRDGEAVYEEGQGNEFSDTDEVQGVSGNVLLNDGDLDNYDDPELLDGIEPSVDPGGTELIVTNLFVPSYYYDGEQGGFYGEEGATETPGSENYTVEEIKAMLPADYATQAGDAASDSFVDSDGEVFYGKYGSIEMSSDGSYTYTPYTDSDLENEYVNPEYYEEMQALNEGDTLTESFFYVVSDEQDGNVKYDIAELQITVNGTNDAPIVYGESGSATETGSGNFFAGEFDFGSFAYGNVLANDTDVDNAHWELDVSSVTSDATGNEAEPGAYGGIWLAGKYGTLFINSDTGAYKYVINDFNGDVQALNEGDTLQESFTYTVTDNEPGNPKYDQGLLNITINGQNDAPVAHCDHATAVEIGSGDFSLGEFDFGANAYGNVLANDTDVDNAHWELDVTKVKSNVNGNEAEPGISGAIVINGEYGTLYLNKDTGSYRYVVDNHDPDVQALNEGDSIIESFTYTITDNEATNAKHDTGLLNITIEGQNDAPVAHCDHATAVEVGSGSFLDGEFDFGSFGRGNVLANDTDVDNAHWELDVTEIKSNETGESATPGFMGAIVIEGEYGTLYMNKDTGSYRYVIDNHDSDVQALNEGDTIQESFTYTVTDNEATNAKHDTGMLVITIEGQNDAPVAHCDHANAWETGSGSLWDGEFDFGFPAIGNVLANDTDVDNAHWELDVTSITSDANGTEAGPGFLGGIVIHGQYGTLVMQADTGAYTYFVDNNNPDVDALVENGTIQETFTYTITDNESGNEKHDSAKLVITINGHNDAPVAVADSSDLVIETGDGKGNAQFDEGTPVVEGNVLSNDSDVDDGDMLDAFENELTVVGVDSNNTDSSSAAGDGYDFVIEGEYGTLYLNEDGSYEYVLNEDADNVQALVEGQDVSDVFTYTVSDNHDEGNVKHDSAKLTINIQGTNDGPVAKGDSKHYDEDGNKVKFLDEANEYDGGLGWVEGNVLSNDFDVDDGDMQDAFANELTVESIKSHSTQEVVEMDDDGSIEIEGEYGTLTINVDGTYEYQLNNEAANVQALVEGEKVVDKFRYVISDNHQEGNAKTSWAGLKFHIEGTNDAPVVDSELVQNMSEINEDQYDNDGDTVADILGSSVTDVDAGAVEGMAITGMDDSNGVWQYKLAGTDTWQNVPLDVDAEHAVLLGTDDSIRFVPDENYYGSADIEFKAWDQTDGNIGDTGFDTTGGNSAFSSGTGVTTVEVDSVPDFINEEGEIIDASIDKVVVSELELPDTDTKGFLLEFGDDTPGTVTFLDQDAPDWLTSDGVPVEYEISADGLTLTATAGGETVFTIVSSYNGTNNFTMTLEGPIDHNRGTGFDDQGQEAADFDFDSLTPSQQQDILEWLPIEYRATDSDGDYIDGVLQVGIEDDYPVAAYSSKAADEATFGSVEGTAPFEQGADGAEVTMLEMHNEKPDGTVNIWNDGDPFQLTSGGEPIEITQVDDMTVQGKVGDTVIYEMTIEADGSYTFTQSGPIDHPQDTGSEDVLTLSFKYTVTDGDGDTDHAWIGIKVSDDEPVAKYSGVEDFDEASFGTIDGQLLFDGGNDGAEVTSVKHHWVDGDGHIHVYDGAGNPAFVLTSGGEEVVVTQDGMDVVGKVGDTVIFELNANPDGSYSFTQSGPIDHPQDSVNAEEELLLRFKFTVTDGDGDTSSHYFGVNISDDTPEAKFDSADIDEAEFTAVSGTAEFDAGNDGAEVTLLEMHNEKPDGTVNIWNSGDPFQLTSGGEAIEISQVDDTTVQGKVGDTVIYEMTIEADGDYTFTQYGPIDHPQDTGSEETLTLSFKYTVTDGDGDTDAAYININVTDDTPDATWSGGEVELNEALMESVDGQLNFDGGNDGAEVTAIFHHWQANDGTIKIYNEGGTAYTLTSGGEDVIVEQDSESGMEITGKLADGTEIFTVVAQPDGSYTFTQSGPIDHPQGTTGEEDLLLKFKFTVTDGDGDTDTSNFNVLITDDTPVAVDDIIETNEDTPVTIDFLAANGAGGAADDFGEDGQGDTPFEILTGPSHGEFNADTGVYTPDADFHGTDTITYKIFDGDGDFDTATININIGSVNDAPVETDLDVNGQADGDGVEYVFDLEHDSQTDDWDYDGTVANPEDQDKSDGGAMDLEDDGADGMGNEGNTMIMFDTLPDHGTIIVKGTGAEVDTSTQYDDATEFEFVPDDNYTNTVLLGTKEDIGDIGEWGDVNDDGTISFDLGGISGTIEGSGDVGFSNSVNTEVGLGLGVEGGSGNGIQINVGESITMNFDNDVSNAKFGFGGMGGHYESDGENAKAHWAIYDDGEFVAEGWVQRNADGDFVDQDGNIIADQDSNTNNILDLDLGDYVFDQIVFTNSSDNSGSNNVVQYMEFTNVLTETATYHAVDSDGGVSGDTATITFNVEPGEPVEINLAPEASDHYEDVDDLGATQLFTLADFTEGGAKDFEDDLDLDHDGQPDGTVEVEIGDLSAVPGTLYAMVGGSEVEVSQGDRFTDDTQFKFVADNVEDITVDTMLLGNKGEGLSITEWGTPVEDADGDVVALNFNINGFTGTITAVNEDGGLGELNHSDIGLGVEGGNNDAEIDVFESITIEFDQVVANATLGFESVAGNYDADSSMQAQVIWTAYLDGEEVGSGVSFRDGDNELILETGNIQFDSIVFNNTSIDDAPSNHTLKFVEFDSPNAVSIDYIAYDSEGAQSETAQIVISETGEGYDLQQPDAIDDQFATDEDQPLEMTFAELLANDENLDGTEDVTITDTEAVDSNGNVVGTIAVDYTAQTVTFTPNADYNGDAQYDYTITDNNGNTDTATAYIDVEPVNDAPVIDLDGVQTEVHFESQNAGYTNMLGVYELDGDGNPVNVQIIMENSKEGGMDLLATLDLPVDQVKLFVITNVGSSYGDIATGEVTFDTSGEYPQLLVDGEAVNKNVFFMDSELNSDGVDHFFETPDGIRIDVNIEDQTGGGDIDYNDIMVYMVEKNVEGYDFETTFTEDGDAVSIASEDIEISDIDDVNMESADIVLTNTMAGDSLTVGDVPAGMTVDQTVDGNGNIVIHLEGSFTKDQYEDAIKGIKFANDSQNPDDTDRVIEVTVNDGDDNSNTAEAIIHVVPVNDPPVLDLNGPEAELLLEESFEGLTNSGWTVVGTDGDFTGDHGVIWNTTSAGLEIQTGNVGGSTASDGDAHAELDPHTAGMNAKISTTVDTSMSDTFVLEFDFKPRPGSEDSSDMKVTFGGEEFTISIDGGVVTYGGAQYTTTDAGNGWTTIQVTFSDFDSDSAELGFEGMDAADTLGAYIDNIKLAASNPDYDYETTYTEQEPPVMIVDSDVFIQDVDDVDMVSATVKLVDPVDGDMLSVVGNMPAEITADVSADGTTITFSGEASIALYEEAFKQLGFSNPTNDDPTDADRHIEFTVNDGDDNSNTAITTVHFTPVNDTPVAVDDPGEGTPYFVALGDVAEGEFDYYEWDGDGNNKASWDNADSKDMGISITAFDKDGNPVDLSESGYNLGVSGDAKGSNIVPDQLEFDPNSGLSESIVIEFNGFVDNFTVGINRMIAGEHGGELGTWTALLDGQVVSSGVIDGTSNSFDWSVDLSSDNLVFNELKFEAIPYENQGDILNDSSDYFITSLTASGPADANGEYVTNEDTPLTVDEMDGLITPNDYDAEGDDLNVLKVEGQEANVGSTIDLPQGGQLTVADDGSFLFDPAGDFDHLAAGEVTQVTFTYTIEDEHGATVTDNPDTDTDSKATVTITIIGVNDAPVAVDDHVETLEDNPYEFTAAELLTNDTDVDTDGSEFTIESVTGAVNGEVTLNADGTVTFTPDADVSGEGSFHYIMSDGHGGYSSGTVTVDIIPDADAPVVNIEVSDSCELVTNMIINGSFEDVSGVDKDGNVVSDVDIPNGSWIGMTEMTGWELLSDTSEWMEPHDDAHAVIGATDGENYMDLGETDNSGDTDIDNTHIGQVVEGVLEGESYTLTFDYKDKAFTQANEADSGLMQVIWGGEVIATIDGNNSEWESFDIEVIGGSGNGNNRVSNLKRSAKAKTTGVWLSIM